MECPQCGADQRSDSLFCTKCGSRLAPAPAPAEGNSEPLEEPLASPTSQEEEKILRELKEALKVVEQPKEKGPEAKPPGPPSRKLRMAAVALLVIVILGGSAVWLRRRLQPSSPQTPPVAEIPVLPSPSPALIEENATRSTVGKMAAFLEAIQKYEVIRKGLPPSLVSINSGYSDPESLKDGWGQNLLYLVDLVNKTYVVVSLGPDGKRGTPDDLSAGSDTRETWLKEHEAMAMEWRSANPNLYAQLVSVGPSAEELRKLQAARKAEALEKKRREELALEEERKQESEKQSQEDVRQEQEKKQAEARRREEEMRQAKLREEAQRRQQILKRAGTIKDNFIEGLTRWDAPSTWETVKEKESSALRVQGLGFLKMNANWDNYKIEFDVRANKESAGWVLRAQNSSNFYLFKLGTDKAKAVPKNSLVKYIFSDGRYLNSLKREDAPGAAGVTLLPFKVRTKDYYHVVVTVRGFSISHDINGIHVDDWTDTNFDHGLFGFNASIIEMVTIRAVSLEPLK